MRIHSGEELARFIAGGTLHTKEQANKKGTDVDAALPEVASAVTLSDKDFPHAGSLSMLRDHRSRVHCV